MLARQDFTGTVDHEAAAGTGALDAGGAVAAGRSRGPSTTAVPSSSRSSSVTRPVGVRPAGAGIAARHSGYAGRSARLPDPVQSPAPQDTPGTGTRSRAAGRSQGPEGLDPVRHSEAANCPVVPPEGSQRWLPRPDRYGPQSRRWGAASRDLGGRHFIKEGGLASLCQMTEPTIASGGCQIEPRIGPNAVPGDAGTLRQHGPQAILCPRRPGSPRSAKPTD